MANVPTTSTTLLKDLARDTQHARWSEFVTRYRPMMEAFMRERFPALDADEAIQETLVALVGVMPTYRYSPDEKGHFRNYLTGILRKKALRLMRKERQQTDLAAQAAMVVCDEKGDQPSILEEDERQYRESLFEIALRLFLADGTVADRTKRIFERTAINDESPESVAAAFRMKRHAVDQAKSRALTRLREIVKQLEAAADE